jgi:hypothetical protein
MMNTVTIAWLQLATVMLLLGTQLGHVQNAFAAPVAAGPDQHAGPQAASPPPDPSTHGPLEMFLNGAPFMQPVIKL